MIYYVEDDDNIRELVCVKRGFLLNCVPRRSTLSARWT